MPESLHRKPLGGATSRPVQVLDRLFVEPRPEVPARWQRWLIVLLALCTAVRLPVGLLATPLLFPDSSGYSEMASMLLHGDWTGYEAVRTPGYPALMALLAGNVHAVMVVQLLLGLVTTALIFWAAIRLTGSCAAAFVAGSLYGLNVTQVQFEATILSESLASALIAATVTFGVLAILEPGPRPRARLLTLGLVAAAAVLTRPALALIPFIAALFVVSARPSKVRTAALVLGPTVIAVLGWSAFNYYSVSSFSPTSITGVALYTHVRDFVQEAPPKYSDIAEVDKSLARDEAGSRPTEWRVARALALREGRSIPEVSSEMLGLSTYLLQRHPAHYIRTTAAAAAGFWKGMGRGDVRWKDPWGIVQAIWTTEKLTMFIAMGVAFMATLVVAVLRWRSILHRVRGRAWLFLAVVVVLSCLFQAMSLYVGNARYGVPFQPVYGLFVVVFVNEFIRLWRTSRLSRLGSCPPVKALM